MSSSNKTTSNFNYIPSMTILMIITEFYMQLQHIVAKEKQQKVIQQFCHNYLKGISSTSTSSEYYTVP